MCTRGHSGSRDATWSRCTRGAPAWPDRGGAGWRGQARAKGMAFEFGLTGHGCVRGHLGSQGRDTTGSTWWLVRIRLGRRSPWVDGVGVAGVTKARCGSVVLGLAVPLVAAVGDSASASSRLWPPSSSSVAAMTWLAHNVLCTRAWLCKRMQQLGMVGVRSQRLCLASSLVAMRRIEQRAQEGGRLMHELWLG